MSIGVKVTREGQGLSLPTGLAGSSGVADGDGVDFEDGGGAPGSVPASAGNFELKNEGGQSFIDDDSFPNAGAVADYDPTDGNVFARTLDDDHTATILEPVGSGDATVVFWFQQDGDGGHVLTIESDGGTVVGDISGHTTTADETFRVVAERVPGSTNDWVVVLVGGSAGEPTADAHIADTSDAHDASAISIVDAGSYYTGTDVEAALQEVPGLISTAIAATPTGHAHVAEETHLSDGSTTTWTLDQVYEPGSVIAWNTTTIARLSVTEVPPDRATVSAAGSSGDRIVFDYAATLGA